MPLTTTEAEAINATAKFHPHSHDSDEAPEVFPCIELGGVQVYVYADPERGLRIAVHLDGATEPLLHGGRMVPLEVDVIGTTPIFTADEHGAERYPLLARDAEDARAAAARVGQVMGSIAGTAAADTVGELHGLAHVLTDRILGR